MTLADWRKVLRTNLSSCYYFCHVVLPYMIKRQNGRIVHSGTEMAERIPPDGLEKILAEIPVRRFAERDEISRVAVFLAQEESGDTTGQISGSNGGRYQ